MISQPINKLISRLWQHLSPRRHKQFSLMLVLMLLASFAEIISIGAVLPFLGILTAPERVFELSVTKPIIQAFNLTEPSQLLLPITIAFGLAALISGAMRLLMLWASTRLSFAIGGDLSLNVYRRTLYQPYSLHCIRNSSEVIAGITGKVNGIGSNVILPALTLINASGMLIAILIALLLINPLIAILAFGGFGFIYTTIIRLTRKRLLIDSQLVARESVQVIKSLQEGLGGIRDVLIDGSQDTYCQIYSAADTPMRQAQGRSFFISGCPRYGLEALGLILISVLAYILSQQPDGIAKAIPVLGALALGAQKLLPVLQQVYGSWTTILSGQVSLQETLALLDQPLPDHVNQPVSQPLRFKYNISLKQLGFRYSLQTPYILKKINLTITKGSHVGFIGTTGSGKSTLLDIVMGLLQPTIGTLEIDEQPVTPGNIRSWQAHIAHVPQAIFLADSSIEENIAFGVPKDQIDSDRVRQAAQQAQISDSIESWPEQYQTFVGERGIRLSGGQRQRIGIARALYKQADVIIFDEATSALDDETEQAVMHAIETLSKNITILIIAHRLTTLKNCSQIVKLSDGCIVNIGDYHDLLSKVE
jgi:ABC-type multidrug transport system fused ATPase/permease subunit